jgi:glutaredoxin
MKKILFISVAVILVLSPFVAATSRTTTTTDVQPQKDALPMNADFTHAVFIEESTATWCPYCPNAAEALFSIYNSSDYPFYYVALVYDQAKLAKDRIWGHYRSSSFPTVFLDGDFSHLVGVGTTPEITEQMYRTAIGEAGGRTIHPLEVTTEVTGNGDATLDISVTVKNTDSKLYVGFLRSYVTEIVSRWDDQHGDPYHFALIGYGLKKIVFLGPQKSKTYTATFDGAAKQGNLTFPDIIDDNIMVISTICHWQPQVIEKDDYVGKHTAFFVDQTVGALVS